MELARILGATTGVPAHAYDQEQLRAEAARVFGGEPGLGKLLRVFRSSGVARRHLARPLPYYLDPPAFGSRNADYIAAATDLGASTLAAALARAGLALADLDHLVFVTTTGVATPSVDALIHQRLGLRPDLERTPIFGIGCAAGAVGLGRAADLARARPGSVVALLSVELCSLTFQIRDLSPTNVIATALFGDGAACAVLSARPGPGPRVVAHRSHTFPDSLDVMGWRVSELGLELVLSRDLPELVERETPGLVQAFLGEHGLKTPDVGRFLVHPGGPKVLDAIERGLGLAPEALEPTRRFLAGHGNLSSASVLFLLAGVMAGPAPEEGERGLALAFGPGFAAELVLLEW